MTDNFLWPERVRAGMEMCPGFSAVFPSPLPGLKIKDVCPELGIMHSCFKGCPASWPWCSWGSSCLASCRWTNSPVQPAPGHRPTGPPHLPLRPFPVEGRDAHAKGTHILEHPIISHGLTPIHKSVSHSSSRVCYDSVPSELCFRNKFSSQLKSDAFFDTFKK